MSETPRTDQHTVNITPVDGKHYSVDYCPNGSGNFVESDRMRKLERDLAGALDAVKRRDAVIEKIIDNKADELPCPDTASPHCGHTADDGDCHACWREWVAEQLKGGAP